MATRRMNQSWRDVMSQIQAIWSEVSFDDKEMKTVRGSLPKMINLIQQKTGESREQILQKMGTVL
jgi:hypothetical protein